MQRVHSPGTNEGKAALVLSHLPPSDAGKPKTLKLGAGKPLQLTQQTIIPKALHEPGRRISPNIVMAQCCIIKFWLCFTSDYPAAETTANHRYLISHD